MEHTKSMTEGHPLKLILYFALPLILANLGQQLFQIVDAVILGQGVGVRGLSAVGAGDWAYFLPLWSVTALTQGLAIPISHAFGEKNLVKLRRLVGTSALLSVASSLLFVLVFLLVLSPLLQVLNTPADIFSDTRAYLAIMYLGLLIVTAYNMAGSVLRALGDSRSPFIAILVAAISNIALDCLFIFGFHWGVAGAAAATVIAQASALIYCLISLKRIPFLALKPDDFRPRWELVKEALRMGSTLCVQHAFIGLGGILFQSAINLQGSAFIAGFTAVNKIFGLLESSAISMGHAVTTFVAQNRGARKPERIRQGVKQSAFFSLLIAVFIAVMMFLLGYFIISLFVEKQSGQFDEVMRAAMNYLHAISLFLPTLYILFITRSMLQGLGQIVIPFLAGFLEFLARGSAALVFFPLWGPDVLYYTEPFAWIAAVLSLIPATIFSFHQMKRDSFVM